MSASSKHIKALFRGVLVCLIATSISSCSVKKENEADFSPLTKSDIQLIDNYVKHSNVVDDVGQLFMVGVPADLNTAVDTENKALDEIIGDQGAGMIIVNGFNYYDTNRSSADDMEYISRVIHFNNILQLKTAKSKNKLPLLIATDFEGPNLPTIKRGVVLPPSALSLSTSQDGNLIQAIGKYIGTELKNIGINVILGPVLDTYNIRQGTKNILQDRCFAATSEGVARTASHYITGLNESGIAVFAKHYPSYGSVDMDPHRDIIPTYEGSKEQMNEELKPFIQSLPSIHAIMTSHIVLANFKEGGIATFSHELLKDLQSRGLENKIFITDDLSDMGAINRYMADNHKSFSEVAIDAFDAGHDVLLYAHVTDQHRQRFSKTYIPSRFRLETFKQVEEKLVSHIEQSEAAMKHFRSALRKVLILKAQIAKINSSDEPISRLLSKKAGSDTAFNFQIKTDARTAIENTEKSIAQSLQNSNIKDIKFNDTSESIGNQLVRKSIREAAIEINKKENFSLNISNYPENRKIIFAVYSEYLDKFKEAFGSHFNKSYFVGIPIVKNTNSFDNAESEITREFPQADLLIYTVRDGSDVDLLNRLKKKFPTTFSKKILIFCHNSPAIFNNSMISDSTIIGNFSMHPISFDVDVEILEGLTTPKGLYNIPINIGDNAQFYSVSNTKWIDSSEPEAFSHLYQRQLTQEEKKEFEKQYIFMIPRTPTTEEIQSGVVNLLLTLVIILGGNQYYQHSKIEVSEGNKSYWVKFTGHPKFGMMTIIVIVILLLLIQYQSSLVFHFTSEISNIYKEFNS
jgi:beta-glucosidase-like glycosyl hydrolase